MAKDSTSKIREALERGEIPERIREGLRIITAGDEARAFQRDMEAMAKEILGEQEYRKLGGVRFYLTDEPFKNAGKLRHAHPPVIIFTRQIIDSLKENNLHQVAEEHRAGFTVGGMRRVPPTDVPEAFAKNGKGMLMGILAHELEHIHRGNQNSKGIEAECDRFAVKKLIELGYREQSLSEALQFLLSGEGEHTRNVLYDLREYLDVHPRTDTRIRLMDNEFYHQIWNETAFRKDGQNRRIKPEPQGLDASFFAVGGSAVYESTVDKLLAARDYRNRPAAEQIRILHDIIKTEAPKWDEEQHSPRIDEVVKHIRALKLRQYDAEEQRPLMARQDVKKALDEMADMLLGVGQANPPKQWYNHRLFENLARECHGTRDNSTAARMKPLGTYEELSGHMEHFMRAETRKQAAEAARQAEALVTRYDMGSFVPSADVKLEMPRFYGSYDSQLLRIEQKIYEKTGKHPAVSAIPDDVAAGMGVKPQWHAHVGWALEGDDATRRLLKRMGIDHKTDPRLPQGSDTGLKLLSEPDVKGIAAANGYLVGIVPGYVSDRDQHYREFNERAALIDQLRRGTRDMGQVDWGPVRNRNPDEFGEFTNTYRRELMPDVRERTPPTEFEKQFTQELEAQLKKPSRHDGYGGRDRFGIFANHFMGGIVHGVKDIAKDAEGKSIYLDRHHPYVGLALRNPGGFLQRYEQAALLEQTIPSEYRHKEYTDNNYNEKMPDYLRQHSDFFRKSLSYRPPDTVQELFKLFEHLDCDRNAEHRDHYRGLLLKDLAELETLQFLKAHPEAQFTTGQLLTLYELGKDELGSLKPSFEEALGNYVEKHSAKELQLGAGELIQIYNLHQRSQLFKHRVDLREVYEKAIMEKVDQVTDPTRKLKMMEALLLRDSQPPDITRYFVYKKSGRQQEEQPVKFLNNPEFRQWAIDRWVDLAAESTARIAANNMRGQARYGYGNPPGAQELRAQQLEDAKVDDGSPEYLRVGKATADRALKGADGVTRSAMLTQFLNKVEAQEKLSFHVRDQLNDITAGDIARLHYQASAGEAFLDHLAHDPDLRVATIEFLRNPLTKDSSKAYADQLRESANRTESYYGSEFPHLRDQIKAARQRADLYDRDQRVSTHAAEMLHRNFSNASMEHRTFLMEKVLFPPNARATPMRQTPQDYVFDKVLPETDEFSKYGRSLFKNYLAGLDKQEDYVRRIYLSAMLVAEDPGAKETDPKKRVGKAIHTLLACLDNPLAGKVSQAIDSSNVPDWLRNPESKIGTNIPARWVVWEMFNQNAPRAVKDTTTRMGKTRAGAIGIAVELDKDTAKMDAAGYAPEHIAPKTVYKMLRKGAAEKVELHAPLTTHMIEESVREFPELSKAKPILAHAIKAARVETDFTNAPVQTEIATRSIDGMRIAIHGETFTFHEVPIIHATKGSHEMAFANGTVFNQLPPEEKGKVAHALITLENYLHLLGQQVDWDRHGAQAIINGHDIYLLDRGGMAIEPPSAEDKKMLGRVIATAMKDHHQRGVAFNDAFAAAVDGMADASGQLNHYLATIARGQHNLGDMRRELTDEQQMQSLVAVLGAGRVDPVIKDTAMREMPMSTKLWLSETSKKYMPPEPRRSLLTFWKAKEPVPVTEKPVVIHDPNLERRQQPLDVAEIKARTIREEEGAPAEGSWQQRRPPRGGNGTDATESLRGIRPAQASWAARGEGAGVRTGKY